MKHILRWILFLPAGILSGGVFQILYPFLASGRYEVNNFIMLLSSFLAGCITIYVCALVAPVKNKLWIVYPVLAISAMNLAVTFLYFDDWYHALQITLQVVGSVVITIQTHRNKIEYNW